jgi:hypothetical protein
LSVIKIADIPEEHDKYVELSGKAWLLRRF